MENLNKLSFHNKKINEKTIFIPMDEIKQEFDVKEYIKPYLFKVVYIHKYHSLTDTFICYLAPKEDSGLPIIKAQIPLELIYTHKIIGKYDYNRALTDTERYIIKEKIFRIVSKINLGYENCFVLGYGYLVNKYKNDDANTKLEQGVQEFNFTSEYLYKFRDGSYENYYVFNKNLRKVVKIMLKCRSRELKIPSRIKKEELDDLISKVISTIKFKKLPENFFVDTNKGGKNGNNRLKKQTQR